MRKGTAARQKCQTPFETSGSAGGLGKDSGKLVKNLDIAERGRVGGKANREWVAENVQFSKGQKQERQQQNQLKIEDQRRPVKLDENYCKSFVCKAIGENLVVNDLNSLRAYFRRTAVVTSALSVMAYSMCQTSVGQY